MHIDASAYSRFDQGFARFFADRSRLTGEAQTRLQQILLDLSAQQAAGHSYLPLTAEQQGLVAVSGLADANSPSPLVLDKQGLYLRRYWRYEDRLAQQLAALCGLSMPNLVIDAKRLDAFFPATATEIDWQRVAAQKVLQQGLTIISGGPGTGKTTTVVKILALLQEFAQTQLAIALAAPTGKAAMRLQEAIANNKANLPCDEAIKAAIPEQVSTLHRLLGPMPPTPRFQHHAEHPLPYDVVVVDECSMVDLALMSKLVDALKPGCRLILLGDKDQLASVEAGAVLADLTQSLAQYTVELQKAHRFVIAIKDLADAVNRQQVEPVWSMLTAPATSEISVQAGDILKFIVSQYRAYFDLIVQGASIKDIFTAFNQFRVLCVNQQGPHSVTELNSLVERELRRLYPQQLGNIWYAGRPVLITANDASLQLYNGDIGLCLLDGEGRLSVYFPHTEGFRALSPARLAKVETVYAMTVHKSQGSEFAQVLIVLPKQINPLLSKELLYTAITRAKASVSIVASREVLAACISRRINRASGLADRLREYLQL